MSASAGSTVEPKRLRSRPARSELMAAFQACRSAFTGVGLISFVSNILMLTGPFFMLEIYDRVLPSRSVPTLIGLAILAGLMYVFQGLLEFFRGRIVIRIGAMLDEALNRRVFDALVRLPLKAKALGDGLQPLRDLDQLRSFLSSTGPMALFDFPWIPIYLAICFVFHPLIGFAATVGGIILVTLTVLTEVFTRKPVNDTVVHAAMRNSLGGESRRNADVLQAMGMADKVGAIWGLANERYMSSQRTASDVAGAFGSVSKVLRIALQSAILGIGAWLVLQQQATAGIIIASSILTSRALAPVEAAIANCKGFLTARQSWRRLSDLLALLPAREQVMALPAPAKDLAVEGIAVVPPGGRLFVVQDITFKLPAGSALGIIGPNAAGKSSLARALVGVWSPVRGVIRLDGTSLDHWDVTTLGRHIGYVPQDVQLFDGTIAENIARFDPHPDSKNVIAAAESAGVSKMIRDMPNGYETRIGEAGQLLSAGQRQRIALARALYGDPFLIVLDEPDSNLDAEGYSAVTNAILRQRKRGGIAVVVAHQARGLEAVDLVLVMKDGKKLDFGPKAAIMTKLLGRQPPSGVPSP